MAHKKGQGSSRNGRDSNPQFRGVKRYAGQEVAAASAAIGGPPYPAFLLAEAGGHGRAGLEVALLDLEDIVGRRQRWHASQQEHPLDLDPGRMAAHREMPARRSHPATRSANA